MSDQYAFERTLAGIHDAMLDDARWPAASALIDEACVIRGNDPFAGGGPENDVRVRFVGIYQRGQRREDLEREYLAHYLQRGATEGRLPGRLAGTARPPGQRHRINPEVVATTLASLEVGGA